MVICAICAMTQICCHLRLGAARIIPLLAEPEACRPSGRINGPPADRPATGRTTTGAISRLAGWRSQSRQRFRDLLNPPPVQRHFYPVDVGLKKHARRVDEHGRGAESPSAQDDECGARAPTRCIAENTDGRAIVDTNRLKEASGRS